MGSTEVKLCIWLCIYPLPQGVKPWLLLTEEQEENKPGKEAKDRTMRQKL